MFPEDKIIEIFSMCDDFSKVFDKTVEQNAKTVRRQIPLDAIPAVQYCPHREHGVRCYIIWHIVYYYPLCVFSGITGSKPSSFVRSRVSCCFSSRL